MKAISCTGPQVFCPHNMIIIIEKIDNPDNLNPSQEAALERLLWAFGRGKHVLWMPIETIDSLLKLTCFSSYSSRALVDLKTFSAFNRNLLRQEFSFRIEVDFSDRHKFISSENKLTVGYEIVIDEKFLLEPVLLTENEIDAQVYTLISNSIFTNNKDLSRIFQICVSPHGGGGCDTIKTFERLLEENRPFLCFLDSDRSHPKGPIGDTAKHFACHRKGQHNNYHLKILDAHEIENLIPSSLIEHLFPTHDLGHLFRHAASTKYKQYPDHKNGLSVESAKAQDSHHNDEFWKDFYHLDGNTFICDRFTNLVDRTKKFLDSNSPHKALEFLNPEKDAELFRISSIIADWGLKLRRELS